MDNFISRSMAVLIFSMPVLSMVLRDWIVLCFVLLIVIALFSLKYYHNTIELNKKERLVITIFAALFLSTLLTFILGNFTISETKHLIHKMGFLGFIPVFLLVRRNGLPLKAFWYGITIGAIITGMMALIEVLLLNKDSASGTHARTLFGDHALLLGMLSILSFSFFREKGRYFILLPIAGLLFGILASVLSGTRGSWLAIPAFLLILTIYFDDFGSVKRRLIFLLSCVLLGLLAYVIPQTNIKHRIDLAVNEINMYPAGQIKNKAVGLRLESWRASKELALEHPITGIGLRQYQIKIRELLSRKNDYDKNIGRLDQPHNQYLYALVERGVIGLLTIILIFIYPAYVFIKSLNSRNASHRPVAIAGLIIVVGYAIFGLTDTLFFRSMPINFYTMMMALLLGDLYAKQKKVST